MVWLQKSGNCSRGHWLREGDTTPRWSKINIRAHAQQTLRATLEADASNETSGQVLDQDHTHTAS